MKPLLPIPELSEADKARYWSKVDKNGPVPAHCPELGPCWVWTGGKRPNDYGYLKVDGHNLSAHRIALATTANLRPTALALHKCDRHDCVNPAHLNPGSYKNNTDDMVAKGRALFQTGKDRMARGERQAKAKLTATQVIKIRQIYSARGATQRELATLFRVTHSAVGNIVSGATWKHVGGPTISRGRIAVPPSNIKGEKHYLAKVTERDVIEIRRLHTAGGAALGTLASMFGLHRSTIYCIVRRRNWKHI